MRAKISNEVIQNIFARRSIRSYEPGPVAPDELETLLACGLQAPSAKNLQPWLLRAVLDPALLAEIDVYVADKIRGNPANAFLRERPNYSVFHRAPAVIFVACDRSSAWGQVDCGILTENIALAAASMGLGTCIIGFVREPLLEEGGKPFLKRLNIPDTHQVLLAVSVGYPAKNPADRGRDHARAETIGG